MVSTSTLLSFSPDVKKHRFFNQKNISEQFVLDEPEVDIKESYFLKYNLYNFFDKIKYSLLGFLETNTKWDVKINSDVFNQSIKILENLYPSIYENLEEDNIYPSNYGTIIFDWKKSENELFSLEIGKDYFGYFIEKNEIDVKQIEFLSLGNDKFNNSMKILLNDLSDFI